MLRGAIVGFGRMGATHFGILNTHPQVQVVAVCDSSSFTLKSIQRFSEARLYNNVTTMLDKEQLDFVLVCTPTASHADVVEATLAAHLHVFVEKPLALGEPAARRLVALVSETDLVNQVGYFLRFNELVEVARAYIARGYLGNLVHYKNEMYGRTVLHRTSGGWRGKKMEGGGCMLDFASHSIDLGHFLFGPTTHVGGTHLKNVYSEAVEDAVYTSLTHQGGVTGTLAVNWSDESYRRPYNRVEIFGTNGRMILDRQECRLYLRRPPGEPGLRAGWNVTCLPQVARRVRFDIRGTEFTAQLDHFIACIEDPATEQLCPFTAAYETDRVIAMIEEDAAGSEVQCGSAHSG